MGKDKKDVRRWGVMTLRNNGASEAQYPLPITHNGARVLFNRDVPVIVPNFYHEQLKNVTLPRFEQATVRDMQGTVRSTDDVKLTPIGYFAEWVEIPDEYQTLEGISMFEKMLSDPEVPLPGFDACRGARIGTRDNSPHSIAWDAEIKAKTEKPAKSKV